MYGWLQPAEENNSVTNSNPVTQPQTIPQSPTPTTTPKPTPRPQPRSKPPDSNVPGPSQQNSGGTNTQVNQNCPGGVCIGGDNNGNPTVNNYAPPQRRLTPDQRNALIGCLRSGAARVYVASAQHNFEAQTFGDDFVSALTDGDNQSPFRFHTQRLGWAQAFMFKWRTLRIRRQLANVLLGCLNASHIKANRDATNTLPSDGVLLYIGVPENSQ